MGTLYYAKYGRLSIRDEQAQYRLDVGSYSGTAGDSLARHNNMAFSTKDRDNDISGSRNCAVSIIGAWWYESSHDSNLNGNYVVEKQDDRGCRWHNFRRNLSVDTSTAFRISDILRYIVINTILMSRSAPN